MRLAGLRNKKQRDGRKLVPGTSLIGFISRALIGFTSLALIGFTSRTLIGCT
jgi:hypothetical protein